jgi:hypothetical protein
MKDKIKDNVKDKIKDNIKDKQKDKRQMTNDRGQIAKRRQIKMSNT